MLRNILTVLKMCFFGKLIRKYNKPCLLQCANLKNKNKKEKLDRVTYKSRNMMTKQDNMIVQFLLCICKFFFSLGEHFHSEPIYDSYSSRK